MAVLIKDIQRNNNEIIRIEVSEFKGRELINIRIWYQSIDSKRGEVVYKPTQKGVALNLQEFAQLKDGIDRLEQYIQDRDGGIIPDQPESEHTMKYDEAAEEDESKSETKEESGEQ